MIALRVIKIGALFLGLSAAVGCASNLSATSVLISPSQTFYLDPEELAATEMRANSGDISAMRKLRLHYNIAVGDAEKAIYWSIRGGDAGDPEMQQGALCDLAGAGKPELFKELQAHWHVVSECPLRDGT